MHQIATQAPEHRSALHVSAKGVGRRQRNRFEILRQLANLSNFLRRTEQEVLVFVVELRQCANDVAGVSADAEFVDPPNVEGNPHKEIVTTGSWGRYIHKSLLRCLLLIQSTQRETPLSSGVVP